jgi:hypothetical protein
MSPFRTAAADTSTTGGTTDGRRPHGRLERALYDVVVAWCPECNGYAMSTFDISVANPIEGSGIPPGAPQEL